MKKLALISLGLLVLHPTVSYGARSGAGILSMDESQLYLYVHKQKNHHAEKVKDPEKLQSNRVYMKYDTDLHRWVYTKTDFAGRLMSPLEYLRPDTVVLGSVIGAELPLERFMLQAPGTWVQTAEEEIYHVWVKTQPPRLEVFTYRMKDPPPFTPAPVPVRKTTSP